jgi:hypothetical protein
VNIPKNNFGVVEQSSVDPVLGCREILWDTQIHLQYRCSAVWEVHVNSNEINRLRCRVRFAERLDWHFPLFFPVEEGIRVIEGG